MEDVQLEKALAIKGWMSSVELIWLARVAQMCEKIVEIGSYMGRSTRALCDNTKGVVIAIDPWDGPYITDNGKVLFDQAISWESFKQNTRDCKNLIIRKETFEAFCWVNATYDFDFVFIDGDHRYESVCRDIWAAQRITKNGGIIAGHDYTHKDWPGVKEAVDQIYPNAEKLDSIWWTKHMKE